MRWQCLRASDSRRVTPGECLRASVSGRVTPGEGLRASDSGLARVRTCNAWMNYIVQVHLPPHVRGARAAHRHSPRITSKREPPCTSSSSAFRCVPVSARAEGQDPPSHHTRPGPMECDAAVSRAKYIFIQHVLTSYGWVRECALTVRQYARAAHDRSRTGLSLGGHPRVSTLVLYPRLQRQESDVYG